MFVRIHGRLLIISMCLGAAAAHARLLSFDDAHWLPEVTAPRKTRHEGIVTHVSERHPYEVPCVLAVPILDGNPAYIQWIVDSTRPGTNQ